MQRILSIIFYLISIVSYSQKNNINLKICPLALIDGFSFPTIQGGLEVKLSDKFSCYNEIGIKYREGTFYQIADTAFIRSSGLKVKTEIRYYLQKQSDSDEKIKSLYGVYIGANLSYIKDFHNSETSYFHKSDSTVIITDDFAVKKHVFVLNFICGVQRAFEQHVFIDLYAGLGIRLRMVHNTNLEYNPQYDGMREPVDFNIQASREDIDINEKMSCLPNLTLGLRIGYQF
jgi:hypothetical protein